MLATASAEARELILQLENRIGYDSNIFRRNQNRTDSGFNEIVPRVTVVDVGKRLNYDLRYQPTYQYYFNQSDVDGWNHLATGVVDWAATPRDTVGLDQTIRDFREVGFDQDFSTVDQAFEETDRNRIRWVESRAYYERTISSRLSARLDIDMTDIDFDSRDNIDNRSIGGVVSTSYVLTELTNVGVSVSGRHRNAMGGSRQPSADSTVGSAAFVIERVFSPTLKLTAQGGPSIIRSEEDDLRFGVFSIQGERTTDVSFFASVELSKEWERVGFNASYVRQESGNNGNVTTSIIDTVQGRLTYRPWRRWKFDLSAEWSQRKSVADSRNTAIGTLNSDDLEVLTVWAQADYRLWENILLRGFFRYYSQDRSRGFDSSVQRDRLDFDVYTGFIAIRYVFAPIKF